MCCAEVSRPVRLYDNTAAASAYIRPLEDRAAIRSDVGELVRGRLEGPRERVVNRADTGRVEHTEATAEHGLIIREGTVRKAESRNDSPWRCTQALWQVRVARVEHRSARRAVDGWAGSTVVLRAGVEGGQKSRSQRALRAIGIHHQSRLRYARVEVADIAELVRVTRMVFPAEAIFQRETRIDAKSILDKKRILNRHAGIVVD